MMNSSLPNCGPDFMPVKEVRTNEIDASFINLNFSLSTSPSNLPNGQTVLNNYQPKLQIHAG